LFSQDVLPLALRSASYKIRDESCFYHLTLGKDVVIYVR
jgi:hypothetical protein